MTPQERAEKIAGVVVDGIGQDFMFTDPLDLFRIITAQIEEAEREAYQHGFCDGIDSTPDLITIKYYRDGFSAAREMARGIAEDSHPTCGQFCCRAGREIADRIAKMEPK